MPDGLEELVDLQLASPGVALVTLNLPQLRNAMTTELTSSWTAVMDQVAGDRSLRAVVVTGTGSAFCSGADLSWLDQGNLSDNTPDRLRDKMLPFYRAWLAPQQIAVPVVAAVNGPAVGACAWRWRVICATPRRRRPSAPRSRSWAPMAGWG